MNWELLGVDEKKRRLLKYLEKLLLLDLRVKAKIILLFGKGWDAERIVKELEVDDDGKVLTSSDVKSVLDEMVDDLDT